MSANRTKLQDRYELREILGRGGMGIVYKAFDRLMSREVALKTILDIDNPDTLQLFYKEWNTLVTMVHPNVINIYDIGEFEQDGATKPFFVMPLLPGVTLDKLIREASPRLSVQGVVQIIDQAARGLHAAHEQGLVHRDVKPSNIFVMDDGSVKIIDFGIARSGSSMSKTTLKGTLFYMAPEQLAMKPPTPLSDLFALGAVTYEALTRRRAFQGSNENEVIEAIQHHVVPPVSEVNHEVSFAISQVIHKAMAKQPWHRFFNIREYGDALMKAYRNEPLEYFDTAKIKPRLERATKSYEQGDYEFASEVLSELEAEGHLDQGIALLRGQVDQAVRQVRIKQMLENARRFFDATEYPLALRKVQEALELDPNDSTALALKGQIEKERREKKIEEWIMLAHQHLDNSAFRQAREALNNVLQIKPNETDALRLAEEVDRREREVNRAREEKSKLYQAAMQAWEKGDVTAAMTKLEVLMAMDRDQPEADTGRSNSYQGFYNTVHSEHNALKNSYDEARRNLAADNFEAASAICKQYLMKYPNHALFQALKFDIDERQRQGLSSMIAETDRRVDAEQDLDRRMAILEEVLKLYPGEPHFVRTLQLVRDKRDLVNSIVAKARYFEERNQFVEALDQWQILKSIHEKQPGLAFEIERLIKRRDQQGRQNSKARWVEQADKYLEGGDYDRAAKTVQSALTEFPNEPELLELDKLVQKNQERAKQALVLLNEARVRGEKGAPETALESLRQAHELDPRNSVIRTVLVNTLIDHARRLVDTNLEAADAVLQEILHLDPKHVSAQSLTSQIADRKREDFITWCLTQARRLQTEADIDGALAVAAQGLAACPNEPRLQQMKATLDRAQIEAQQRQAKPKAASTLTSSTASLEIPPALPPSLPATANPPPLSADQTETIAMPSPFADEPTQDERSQFNPAPVPPPSHQKYVMAGVAGGSVLLLLLGAAVYFRGHATPPPPGPVTPATVKVSLHSTPSGAEITVNGQVCGTSKCDMDLAPGDYRAEAHLADYQPATANFTVAADQNTSPDIDLALSPAPPILTVATDLSEGTLLVDGASAGQLGGGEIDVARLAPGDHTVSLQSGRLRGSFTLTIAAGALSKVTGPIQVQGLQGLVIVRNGTDAHVYGSVTGGAISLDGRTVGVLAADGLDLKDVAAGSHEIVMSVGGDETRLAFQAGQGTAIASTLVTNQSLSILNIVTGEDGVEVYLNGKKYRRTTKDGRLSVYLPPNSYAVRVQKDGMAAPPEQTVELKRGQESTVQLKMGSSKATLAVHHGVPGSEVMVDGNRIGILPADGEFSAAYIDPGKHTVSLRHDRYRPLQSDQVFAAGKSIDMDGTLQTLFGTLRIDMTPAPPDAHVRLKRQGDAQDREIKETNLSLQEGLYTITATAPRYQDASATVRVTGGNTVAVTLPMKRVEPATPAKVVPPTDTAPVFGLADWLKLGGWTRDGQAIRRQGGEYVLTPMNLTVATIQFTVASLRGRHIEWVAGFADAKNYYQFQIDDSNVDRTQVTDGKRSKTVKAPHGVKREQYNTFIVKITAREIVTSVLRNGALQTLDLWQPLGGPAPGKFGFHIQGKDEIGLTDFKLTQP